MPLALDAKRQQINTHRTDRREAEREMINMLRQKQMQASDQIFEDAYLDQAVETYLITKKGLAKKSYKKYKQTIDSFREYIIKDFGHIPKMVDIRKEKIEKYLGNLIDEGYSNKTYNDKRNILTNFFIYGVSNNWMRKNPVHDIKSLPKIESTYEPLSKEDINKILDYFNNEENGRRRNRGYYPILAIIYYAGLRISEITHLQRKDIDLNIHSIHIRNKIIQGEQYTTKTRRNWSAPINRELEAILREWLKRTSGEDNDLLFPNSSGRTIKTDAIAIAVKLAMKELGFPEEKMKKPLHGGRHAFAKHASESGVSEEIVQEALGHKSNIMTKHYVKFSPRHKRKEFNQLDYNSKDEPEEGSNT